MLKNIIYLFCPVGIGCDAKVAYDFHTTREEKPDQFCSQVGEYNFFLLQFTLMIWSCLNISVGNELFQFLENCWEICAFLTVVIIYYLLCLPYILVENIIVLIFSMQFVNKLIYAREGAKDMMDRSCSDLPWHVSLEVDGKNIEIPEVNYFISFICHSFVI